MKIYAYILIVLSGVLTAQCSKVTLDEICGYPSAPGGGNGEGEGNGDYNSYWYYSYEAAQLIDAETLGMETAEDFTPYTVAHLGDTLFIANIGKAGSSLLLFSIKKGERLGTLQSWQHDGGEKSFGSQIEAIVPSGNRLYVAERQSRIHVFRLPELSYLTCIGNGQWSGPVFQAQAMTVKDGLIFARDKNGMVSIYKEEDATPENYQKVNRYRRASGNGSPGNNGFASHSMQPDAEGHLLLTDYEGKKIRVLDPALVNDDLANDASIDLDDLSLSPGFKPKTLALCGDRWYATGDNDAINIYERQSNEWSKKIKTVKGYAFSQPARIFIHIYQHCQSFNATVNTNRSFTCNIDYVIGEAILFIWLHTHHNPLSRLPYRPHNQLYLSRHIGTAAQTTAHLLQLLPEVRIIVNPILQLTVSHLRVQIRK